MSVATLHDAQIRPGWVVDPGGRQRFHIGLWIDQAGKSQRALAEEWGCDAGYLTRASEYTRKIGMNHRDGKEPLGVVVFRSIEPDATYADYEDSYEYFHQKHIDDQRRIEDLVSRFGKQTKRKRR